MNKIIVAEPRAKYRVWLEFADGAQGEVDLSDLAGRGVFAIWDDLSVFESVSVNQGDALSWSNEVDLGWDALYLRLPGKAVDEVFPGLKKESVDA